MGDRKPEDLIGDIIAYLEKERELFGEFSILPADNNAGKKTTGTTNPVSSPGSKNPKVDNPGEDNSETGSEQILDIATRIDRCETLEELRILCEEAEELKTDLKNTNLVFGVGNPEADLMLIGEAPGEEEDKQGEPFVGAAGKLLNKILAAIDFKREDVYIANILKHRPPNNRDPLQEERRRSLPFLLKQIDLINPSLILCLGKVAAQTLLERDDTLTSMRGIFHPFHEKYELLVTFHPAALLYHPKWKRPTWEDVQKLRERYDDLGCTP